MSKPLLCDICGREIKKWLATHRPYARLKPNLLLRVSNFIRGPKSDRIKMSRIDMCSDCWQNVRDVAEELTDRQRQGEEQ